MQEKNIKLSEAEIGQICRKLTVGMEENSRYLLLLIDAVYRYGPEVLLPAQSALLSAGGACRTEATELMTEAALDDLRQEACYAAIAGGAR